MEANGIRVESELFLTIMKGMKCYEPP